MQLLHWAALQAWADITSLNGRLLILLSVRTRWDGQVCHESVRPGAGVIGLTAVRELAERGVDVRLIDRHNEPGMEASFANGSQLSHSYVVPLASPDLFDSSRLTRSSRQAAPDDIDARTADDVGRQPRPPQSQAGPSDSGGYFSTLSLEGIDWRAPVRIGVDAAATCRLRRGSGTAIVNTTLASREAGEPAVGRGCAARRTQIRSVTPSSMRRAREKQ